MRKHQGLLRYGYQMAGTATGRFTLSRPAIHNFSAKGIDTSTFVLPEEQQLSEVNARYDLRSLLIQGEGVYKLDFATHLGPGLSQGQGFLRRVAKRRK